jgi:hypothetical protein
MRGQRSDENGLETMAALLGIVLIYSHHEFKHLENLFVIADDCFLNIIDT